MEKMSVAAARRKDAIGKEVLLQGWVRTRRDSKAGFSFIELNDGSSMANIQVIADAELENYESEIKKLTTGCGIGCRIQNYERRYDAKWRRPMAGRTGFDTSVTTGTA